MTELRVNDRMKLRPIQKLYFRTYPFRVQVSLAAAAINLDQRQRFRKQEMAAAVAAARSSTQEWNYRLQAATASFYFEVHDDAVAFARAVSDKVIEANAPSSCFPIGLLSEDQCLRYRESLWFYKFRYQIQLRPTSDELSTKIQLWLDETFDYAPGDESDRIHACFGDKIVIYLADEDDMIFVKLYLSEHLRQINRIILHNEHNQ